MKVYLVSNNSMLDKINYENIDLELVRLLRPLSIEGELFAKNISDLKELESVEKIYTSIYTSAVCSAKYLSSKLDLKINMNMDFNDCLVGNLGAMSMKRLKEMQEHDFNYKIQEGESLNEVGNRLDKAIKKVINNEEKICIFTHKRAILGYLLKYTSVGYNLDDKLILEYNETLVYGGADNDYDVHELTFNDNELVDIKCI